MNILERTLPSARYGADPLFVWMIDNYGTSMAEIRSENNPARLEKSKPCGCRRDECTWTNISVSVPFRYLHREIHPAFSWSFLLTASIQPQFGVSIPKSQIVSSCQLRMLASSPSFFLRSIRRDRVLRWNILNRRPIPRHRRRSRAAPRNDKGFNFTLRANGYKG